MTEEEKKARHKIAMAKYEAKPDTKLRRNERARKRRHADKDAYNAQQRVLHKRAYPNLARNLSAKLNAARTRARHNGMEFNISAADLHIPDRCPILGTKLVPCGRGANRVNSLSLDRIDNTKGYVKGNVAVISTKANLLKNALTLPVAKQLVAYMELHAITA